jgi:polysaccharide biosynthesis/export protein
MGHVVGDLQPPRRTGGSTGAESECRSGAARCVLMFVRNSETTMPKLLVPSLFVLLLGCGGSGGSRHTTVPAQPVEYRLGAEDLVEVNVWKEPGLSTTAPVRPDGKISVPVAGELVAEGKTTHQLEKEITVRLKGLVASPIVSVIVKEIHASRIYVVGEVAKPGVYPLRGRLDVLQAIAVAGGLTEFADRDDITVLRRLPDGKEERLGFSYGANTGRLALYPGDTVVVK